jgi:hypothetical protein
MPSPIPKPAATRARRNKTSTHRQLEVVHEVEAPKLPSGRKWQKATRDWWRDVWASPMAPEYDSSDVHGLFMLAVLVDQFWVEPSEKAAAEIRLQRQCFGLTPIDRRRLQWEIDRGDSAAQKTRKRRAQGAPKPEAVEEDPRRLLA